MQKRPQREVFSALQI